ncbi:MAG: PEP-CTERM sorting domain-containing protein [Phycisphaeraceae bacterium]
MVTAAVGAVIAIGMVAQPASAAIKPIEIHITGIDLVYDGVDLYDAGGIGSGGPDADSVPTADFFFDDNHVGSLSSDQGNSLFSDVRVDSLNGIPHSFSGGTFSSNSGSLFDLFGDGTLKLSIDGVDGYAGPNLAALFLFTGIDSVVDQSLPFGLQLDENEPIELQFGSVKISNVTESGGFITGFNARGTATITGMGVPEPGTLALASTAAGLILLRRRRETAVA